MSGLKGRYKYHVRSQISDLMEVGTSYWDEENERGVQVELLD